MGTLAGKNTIETIVRGIRKMKPDCKYTDKDATFIKELFEKDEAAARKKYADIFYYYNGLLNTPVSQSQHPAGIVASPMNLIEACGMFLGSDGQQILPLDMEDCHALGLIKYDILGLKTIGVIDKTCKMIGQHFPAAHEIDFNDQAVYDDMNNNPATIFQFESGYAQDCFKKMGCHSIDDITLVNAALRPGGASYRDRLFKHEINDNGSEIINNILKESYGFLCYQEEITAFLQYVCGFSGSDADSIRRCVDEDTLILMGDGNLKPIKNIECGEYVQSYNQYNISEYQKVLNVFDNGIQETYCIKSNNGYQLIATASHKILTQDGYKTISDLTLNDYIMTPRKINALTDGLKSNKHLSEPTMYLLGLLIGDGCMIDSNVHFTNHEMVLIDKFKDCVNNLSRSKENDCEFCIAKQKGINVDYIYSIYIKSSQYKQMLRKIIKDYDLAHRAKDKYIPNAIMLYPKGTKLINLLAGLFNTDGGYNVQNNALEYYSNSFKLVWQIKSLLAKFNIYSYVSTKFDKKYQYDKYQLTITQKTSLNNFKNIILPYIIGQKHDEFLNIIEKVNNTDKTYDYLLPEKCRNEIRTMTNLSGISINSIQYGMKVSNSSIYNQITNLKAHKIVQHIYCPYTYQLLFADYIPLQIKSIEKCGQRHVYDLEVEQNHNYVANGVIVHNCIAKKDANKLAQAMPQILEGYCSKSDKSREVAEQEAKQFLKVIEDASEYMFNKNHALGYSLLTYLCGYYRYYYPVEYCTAYILCAKNQDDFMNGRALANSMNINIMDIQFRYTSWDYRPDAEKRTIYKGLLGVKYMNKKAAETLYALRDVQFEDFVDLLAQTTKNKVDTRQLEILTKLNFFKEFGGISYLLKILETYKKYKNRKQVVAITRNETQNLRSKQASEIEAIEYEFDAIGTLSRIYPNMPKSEYYIIDKDGRKGQLYQMATGKIYTIKFTKKDLFNVGMLIKITSVKKDRRWYMDDNGKWKQKDDEYEPVIHEFVVLNGKQDEN